MRETHKQEEGEIRKINDGSTCRSAGRKCVREFSRCRPRRNPSVFLKKKKEKRGGRKYVSRTFVGTSVEFELALFAQHRV